MRTATVKRKRFKINSDSMWGYGFILAAIVIFALFTLYPVAKAFIMSFQNYKPIGSTWVGLDNYKTLLTDRLFGKSLVNTVIYTVGTVPISLFISFSLAVLISMFGRHVQTAFKAIYYLPAVASGVTLAVVWLWIYDSMPSGILNSLVQIFGIPCQNWLGSSKTSMFSLILMSWLAGHGTGVIIYVAALLGLPNDYFEVADMDGATFFQKIRLIVFPLLKPTTLFLLVTGIIGSFQVFQNAYLMTGGGPDNSTTTVGLLIFYNAFKYFDFGKATAQSIVLTAIIAIISLIQFKFFGSDVEY